MLGGGSPSTVCRFLSIPWSHPTCGSQQLLGAVRPGLGSWLWVHSSDSAVSDLGGFFQEDDYAELWNNIFVSLQTDPFCYKCVSPMLRKTATFQIDVFWLCPAGGRCIVAWAVPAWAIQSDKSTSNQKQGFKWIWPVLVICRLASFLCTTKVRGLYMLNWLAPESVQAVFVWAKAVKKRLWAPLSSVV